MPVKQQWVHCNPGTPTPLHAPPRTQLAKLQDGFYLGKGLPKLLGGDKAEKSHEAKIGAVLAGILSRARQCAPV